MWWGDQRGLDSGSPFLLKGRPYTHPFSVFPRCSPAVRDRGRPLLALAGRHRQSTVPDKTRLVDGTGEEVVIAINRRPTVASARLLPTGSGRKEAAEGRDGTEAAAGRKWKSSPETATDEPGGVRLAGTSPRPGRVE